jgi:hypothetical protein
MAVFSVLRVEDSALVGGVFFGFVAGHGGKAENARKVV